MTTISSNPSSYLATLLNPASTASTSATSAASELDTLLGGSGDGSSAGTGATSAVKSLLGTGTVSQSALSSSALSALQEYQNDNSTAVANLFGSQTGSLTDGVEDSSSVYDQALQQAYQIAGIDPTTGSGSGSSGTPAPASNTNTDPVQNILSSYNTAINAYNTTLLSQAKTVLADNSSLNA